MIDCLTCLYLVSDRSFCIVSCCIFTRQNQLHLQVCLCNLVRTVVEGKAVVSPVIEVLSTADDGTLSFLIKVRVNYENEYE